MPDSSIAPAATDRDASNRPSAATLPIGFADGLSLDLEAARAFGKRFAERYAAATPFPHIVLDGLLPEGLAREIVARFPAENLPSDTVFDMGYAGFRKRQVAPADCDRFNRDLFAFFNAAPMLGMLESLSGIMGLIPDPYFSGGGFHEISRGGLLGVHADFRINQQLNLKRRINVLVYLNPGWQTEWGGNLELWDSDIKQAARSIAPLFNRCVIFNTDAKSFHGHPEPLACPDGVTRRSIALYYYTASDRIYDDTPSLGTMYRARPGDTLKSKAEVARLRAENYLIRDWMPPVVYRGLKSLRRRGKQTG